MKIGLVKFCIPIDLLVGDSVSNSGVEDRYGFIRELLRRGHEIHIFTPLVRGTESSPREERFIQDYEEKDIPEHVRWLKKIHYHPRDLPVGKLKMDVLVAEAGVGNAVFGNKHAETGEENPESTLIRRFVHVVDAHRGPVFYLQNDPTLPFYFRQLAGRKYPWGDPKNGYTNPTDENRREGWVRDSAWATHDEIFKGKRSIILTRTPPDHMEFMIEKYDSDRSGYKEYRKLLHFEYCPPAYEYSNGDAFSFQREFKYPLFYSGGDRHRRHAFRRYYEDMGVPTYVSGKWKDDVKATFEGINWLGWINTRTDFYSQLNLAGCVIQILPRTIGRLGFWTARPMEVPAMKSMCFMDGEIRNASDMVFDDWFVVKNKQEAQRKIAAYLSMPNIDRRRIVETQLAYCRNLFTWERFVNVFTALANKHAKQELRTVPRPVVASMSYGVNHVGENSPEWLASTALEQVPEIGTGKPEEPVGEVLVVPPEPAASEPPAPSVSPPGAVLARSAEVGFLDIPITSFPGLK